MRQRRQRNCFVWMQPKRSDPNSTAIIFQCIWCQFAAEPTNTVFVPSIGPKYLPCSNRESRGPRRRLDGCKSIHHTRSPNCAKGRTARLPTFRSCAVLPSRPTANKRCVLVAYGTSHVNRSWSAGTSTPQANTTASLIDMTCSFTTFTELSAAPLDCGSPSADVSCTTSPVQANFTTVSNSRIEGSLSHRNTTLLYPKLSKSSTVVFTTFFTAWEVNSLRGNQMSEH